MQEEIGKVAGAIWHTLEKRGELTVASLKKEVDVASPAFDWAIGWLAREHKIIIAKDKRSWLVRLEGQSSNGERSRETVSALHETASA